MNENKEMSDNASLGEGGEMKISAWDWVLIAAITPGVLILIVVMSPLIAALAAYDLVFFGWISSK